MATGEETRFQDMNIVVDGLKVGADNTDNVTIKGFYVTPAVVAVTVPAITDS